MKLLKSIGKQLLFPPLALALPLVLLAFGLLMYVFSAGLDGTPIAYAAYALSAYALVVACASIPRALRLAGLIRRNAHVSRFLNDYAFRTQTALRLGLLLNLAFAAFKFVAGALYGSYWLIALGLDYAVLALMRFFLLRRLQKTPAQPDARSLLQQYKTYRLTGALMFALNIVMSAIILQVVLDNRTYSYPGTIVYAFAAYAFYKVITAAVNLIRRRKRAEPLFAAARCLNLAVAMTSIFSLQTALLSMFGGSDAFRLIMNAASGCALCMGILLIAVMMVIRGTSAIRRLSAGKP
ncbi:MAG: hypothetical protein Q4G52_09270 [Clostridia bacterium]|nr:hypothetical protein [Clostridia bacterium]